MGCPEVKALTPTSVPGLIDPRAAANRQRGFSLLEMMVVLLIIGIATAAASVSMLGNPQARKLREDGQRLAQLFVVAQTEAEALRLALKEEGDQGGDAARACLSLTTLANRLAAPA